MFALLCIWEVWSPRDGADTAECYWVRVGLRCSEANNVANEVRSQICILVHTVLYSTPNTYRILLLGSSNIAVWTGTARNMGGQSFTEQKVSMTKGRECFIRASHKIRCISIVFIQYIYIYTMGEVSIRAFPRIFLDLNKICARWMVNNFRNIYVLQLCIEPNHQSI